MILCGYAEARLRALVDGELAPGEARKVLEHVEHCSRCAAAHARVQAVSALLQEQLPDEAPAHFSASLQVRLARHRRGPARAAAPAAIRDWLRLNIPNARLLGGLSTAAVVGAVALTMLASSTGISAAEVARRAEETWLRTRNYGCVFESRGVYQGQPRTFVQRQFFRRPGEFRLDTAQDYPLTTYVYRDRVIHYLPGGDWKHHGPLVLIRPRTEGQTTLPFPFGVTWGNGGNVSLDGLIRQLGGNNTELLGLETVGDRRAYHLQFMATPPGARQGDQYELWIDEKTFLPCRVRWFRDADNHIETEAKELQTNINVLPAGTFTFTAPHDAFVIHGDLDPHVMALPYVPERSAGYDLRPIAAAEAEMAARAKGVPFPAFVPHWLPDGYELVRVRRRSGRWLDAYWIREEGASAGRMIKLLEQPAESMPPDSALPGVEVDLGSESGPLPAHLVHGSVPYPYVSLTWQQGATRCTLFAAELSVADSLRIARSVSTASPPRPAPVVARADRPAIVERGEPSSLPGDADSVPPGAVPAGAPDPAPTADLMPMMPEMPDQDHAARTRPDGG